MDMLLNLEYRAILLHFHADNDIQIFSLGCGLLVIFPIFIKLWRISILHVITGMMAIRFHINTFFDKIYIKLVYQIVFSLKIDHRACLTLLVNKE